MGKGARINFAVEWYDAVSSTNDVCMQAAADGRAEGLVVAAHFQEHGRGQRGNAWESGSGLNLTFSVLLRPTFIRVEEQFLISKVVAVAICDWVAQYVKDKSVAIKWPNDIYVDDCKIAGVLIENSFNSSELSVSVVGIGVNVNQVDFSSDVPNPTSLRREVQREFNLQDTLQEFVLCLSNRYSQVSAGVVDAIHADYLGRLYRKNTYCLYRAGGEEFRAVIVGVKPTGELQLLTEQGQQRSFAFKEVAFVI